MNLAVTFSLNQNVEELHYNMFCSTAKRKEHPMDDEQTILRKMRRMTEHYEIHKEIGR